MGLSAQKKNDTSLSQSATNDSSSSAVDSESNESLPSESLDPSESSKNTDESSEEEVETYGLSVAQVKQDADTLIYSSDIIASISRDYNEEDSYVDYIIFNNLNSKYCYIGNKDAMCIAYPKGENIAFYSRFSSVGIKNLLNMVIPSIEDEDITESNYEKYLEEYKENTGSDINFSYSNGYFYINQGMVSQGYAEEIEKAFRVAIPVKLPKCTDESFKEVELVENNEASKIYNIHIGGYPKDSDVVFNRKPDEYKNILYYSNDELYKIDLQEDTFYGKFKGYVRKIDSSDDVDYNKINYLDKDFNDNSYEEQDFTKAICLPDMVKACIYK